MPVIQSIEHGDSHFGPFTPKLIGASQVHKGIAAHPRVRRCETSDRRKASEGARNWIGGSRDVMDHGLAAQAVVPFRTQSCIGLVGRCAAWCESSRRDEVR